MVSFKPLDARTEGLLWAKKTLFAVLHLINVPFSAFKKQAILGLFYIWQTTIYKKYMRSASTAVKLNR